MLSLQALGVDKKADRPFRDAGQEASAPLLSTGDDERIEQSAQAVGEPAGLKEPKAEIPQLVNLLETGAYRSFRRQETVSCTHQTVASACARSQ